MLSNHCIQRRYCRVEWPHHLHYQPAPQSHTGSGTVKYVFLREHLLTTTCSQAAAMRYITDLSRMSYDPLHSLQSRLIATSPPANLNPCRGTSLFFSSTRPRIDTAPTIDSCYILIIPCSTCPDSSRPRPSEHCRVKKRKPAGYSIRIR